MDPRFSFGSLCEMKSYFSLSYLSLNSLISLLFSGDCFIRYKVQVARIGRCREIVTVIQSLTFTAIISESLCYGMEGVERYREKNSARATVAPPADHLLHKLSLDSQVKALEIPEPNKKTAVYQYGGVDIHGQVPSYDRSLTPMLPSDAVDPSVCYVPNAYQPYYYGYGSGQEWSDYTAYTNPEGVDMNYESFR